MVSQIHDDPLDAAMNTEYDPTRTYFGQVHIDSHFCVLIKGTGKEVFDPSRHKLDDRRTAIGIDLYTLGDERRDSFLVQRELIAESREWGQFVKPSLRALGVDLRTLNGKWAQVQLAPTGRKYVNRDGEERDATAFKFLAVYDTEQECRVAAAKFFGQTVEPEEPPAPTEFNDPERKALIPFLTILWSQCKPDAEAFYQKIAATDTLNKHFHSGSREVIELVFEKEPVPAL